MIDPIRPTRIISEVESWGNSRLFDKLTVFVNRVLEELLTYVVLVDKLSRSTIGIMY